MPARTSDSQRSATVTQSGSLPSTTIRMAWQRAYSSGCRQQAARRPTRQNDDGQLAPRAAAAAAGGSSSAARGADHSCMHEAHRTTAAQLSASEGHCWPGGCAVVVAAAHPGPDPAAVLQQHVAHLTGPRLLLLPLLLPLPSSASARHSQPAHTIGSEVVLLLLTLEL